MNSFSGLNIRVARIGDAPALFDLIGRLAEFEKLSHEVLGSQALLEETLFSKDSNAHAIIGEQNEKPVGFALYFFNYSTFLARPGLYLEDLFVLPEMRGKGIGDALLTHLAQIACEKNCGRMEWSVLDWNQRAADFYEKKIGARPVKGWTVLQRKRLPDQIKSNLQGHLYRGCGLADSCFFPQSKQYSHSESRR